MSTATAEREKIADFAAAQPATSKGHVALVPPPAESKAYPPKLAKALMAITREFGPITKGKFKDDPHGGWNDFHSYGYQKWEDVLERESTLLAQHGIIIQQSETQRSLLDKLISISYEFTIISEDGDVWPDRPVFTAIGRLQDNKGIFDDKAANKCHTQAHKYFLLHFFKIRTKEAVEADADADDDVPAKQVARPPRPGSAEAKAADRPHPISGTGPKPQDWADAFVAAIERAETNEDVDRWVHINAMTLDRLEGAAPDVHRVVMEKVKARRDALRPKPPRPPRPGADAGTEKVPGIPNPDDDPAGWIEWLGAQLATFNDYEEGEAYWNDHVAPVLDGLPQTVQEDATGLWRKFELRHES